MAKLFFVVVSLLSLLQSSLAASIFKANISTVYNGIIADPEYTTLKAFIDTRAAAGLKKQLQDPAFRGTLFAPTNQALQAYIADNFYSNTAAALSDKAFVVRTLKYQFSAHTYLFPGKNIKLGRCHAVPNMAGKTMFACRNSSGMYLKSRGSIAKVLQADNNAPNAIIHKTNAVAYSCTQTVYKWAKANGYTRFVEAVDASARVAAATGINVKTAYFDNPNFTGTVFVPVNSAFDSAYSGAKVSTVNKISLTAGLEFLVIPDKQIKLDLAAKSKVVTLTTARGSSYPMVIKPDSSGFLVSDNMHNVGDAKVGSVTNMRTCKVTIHTTNGFISDTLAPLSKALIQGGLQYISTAG